MLLRVIRMVEDGIAPQAAGNQFDVTVENVMSIMQTPKKIESLKSLTPSETISVSETGYEYFIS